MTTELLDRPAHAPGGSSTATAEPDDNISTTRQFVTFVAGNEVFAVDMAPVQEIIRVPQVVRVPLAPPTLDGLANLRGKVLPVISLRRLFGFPEQAHDDSTRAVVIDVGQPLGFVVDRVASVVGVEPRQIEDVGSISSTVRTDLLSGMIKDVGGHAMIMVLDFRKLIEREFAQIAAIARTGGGIGLPVADTQGDDVETSDEVQLVSFAVAGQEYAITIDDVQEIVQIPDTIIHVPRAETHVLGVMTLRSRLLPLVNLRCMFGLPERELDEKSRIVVLSLGSASVGIAVDGVNEVLRVARSIVETMPALLARSGELAGIGQICQLEQGKRLVSIIETRNLFDHSIVKEALGMVTELGSKAGDAGEDSGGSEDALDDDEQVVVFLLDKEEFGVPIVSVQEIVRVPEELIRVPRAAVFIEGVINLRGSVLPVVDLRRRLGLPQVERSERQRIMVFLLGNVRTGFIVDQVAEVLKIPRSAIEPAPKLSSDQGRLLSRMANLDRQSRMVQLLDPLHLVDSADLEQLAVAAE